MNGRSHTSTPMDGGNADNARSYYLSCAMRHLHFLCNGVYAGFAGAKTCYLHGRSVCRFCMEQKPVQQRTLGLIGPFLYFWGYKWDARQVNLLIVQKQDYR